MPTFFNQATLSYNDNVTNSNVVTGELVTVLTATKTAVTDTYRMSDTVTYVVSIINAGVTPYTGLTVTDDLGAYPFGEIQVVPLDYVEGSVKYFVNGVLQASPAAAGGPPLVFSGVNVPAGGNAILIYSATVNSFAPPVPEGSIVNTVTVSGGGLTTAVTASEMVTAEDGALLTITKSLSPTTVVGNGPLTYTFVIQNTGASEVVATDDASVTDVFDPVLAIQSVTLNGVLLTEPDDYTYDEVSGVFTTVPGRITVPAATYTQDPETGRYVVTPGVATLTVTGTV